MEKSTSRLKVLAILVALMFAALTTRLWFLQVLAVGVGRDRHDRPAVGAVRGDGRDPRTHLRRPSSPPGPEPHLARGAGDQGSARRGRRGRAAAPVRHPRHPRQEIREALDSKDYYDYQSKPVAYDVEKDVSFYLSEHADEFPGVEVVPAAVRDYPNGTMAAHVLGWVGQINAEEHRRHEAVQGLRAERPRRARRAWRSSTSGSCGARRGGRST